MDEPLAPYLSPPVVATKAEPPTEWFGTTWQEIVTRIEGFRLEVSNQIWEIENFSHDECRDSMERYTEYGSFRLFLLHPGEYITKVDVTATKVVIKGLRIHTSKRVSPWFGERKGKNTSFTADVGFCIHAFRGSRGTGGCTQLGVVFVPLAVACEGHSLSVPQSVADMHHLKRIRKCDLELRTCSLAPRAIVVNVQKDNSIGGVRVVSRAEYARYTSFEGPFEVNTSEHWVILADDERIESASITVDDGKVSGIFFKTNMQNTPGFGLPVPGGEPTKRFECRGSPKRYICGFTMEANGELRAQHTLVVLGVIFADPAAQLNVAPGAMNKPHPSKAA